MKILKKLLIICCFSLLFIINTNADETKYIIPSTQEGRIDLISNFISTDIYSNFIEDVRQGNFNRSINNTYYDFTDNYVLYIDFNNLNNYNFNVRFFRVGSFGLTLSSLNLGTLFNFTVTFDNVTHEIVSRNFVNTQTGLSYNINYETNSDGNLNIYVGPISSTYPTYFDTTFLTSVDYTFTNNTYYDNGNALLQLNGGNYARGEQVPTKYFFETMNSIFAPQEPSYTMQQEVLDNGSVKLTFNFTNYDTNNNYGFTITNKVSGEEYGIENPYVNIFPNIIPFGSSYEVILEYDTVITVSLSKYIPIDGTDLYDREPIFVDSYDINNIVFSNPQLPYFSIVFQNKNNLIGKFNNINNNFSCYYKLNTDNVETNVDCNETLDLQFNTNGYIDIIIKKQNNVVYDRKINILGGSELEPYIVYNIEKQDFYSKINWYVQNYNNQLKYRYSINNGLNFSSWENLTTNQQFLNIYQNSTVIIEISNIDNSIIYDSKAINVVVSIENLNNFNNTTNNLIDKFNNIFNVNGNILLNIESYWSTLKTTKLYLFVFIPFITSIICAIIYLIRRK